MDVSTPRELAAQADAVRRVHIARINRDNAIEELEQAIRTAYEKGCAVKDIAAAAEVTRQRIFQIVRPGRGR